MDKLWEKDYSMNPYHYSHNNPISRLDPSGYFDPPVHAEIIESSGYGNYSWGLINGLHNDVLKANLENAHFDNKQNYNQVMDVVNNAGGFNNLDVHTMGDFYAHSNYVELWNELSPEGKVTGEPPTFQFASGIPAFQEKLECSLRTTNYPAKDSDPYGHNKGANVNNPKLKTGGDGKPINKFQSKDKPTSNDDKLNKQAKELYNKSLQEKKISEVNK